MPKLETNLCSNPILHSSIRYKRFFISPTKENGITFEVQSRERRRNCEGNSTKTHHFFAQEKKHTIFDIAIYPVIQPMKKTQKQRKHPVWLDSRLEEMKAALLSCGTNGVIKIGLHSQCL